MSFKLKTYQAPDFTQPSLMNAPEARLEPAPFDKVCSGRVSRHHYISRVF